MVYQVVLFKRKIIKFVSRRRVISRRGTFDLSTDRRNYLPSVPEIGRQCNYGSNLLHIDRHADAARARETDVREFQVHSSMAILYYTIANI